MLKNPQQKYHPFPPIDLPDRQWCNRTLRQAPIWLSTDLRDGNQALFEPMNGETKLRLFNELVNVGFKEIEVGFPAASETDFNFVRRLIEQQLLPDDVTPMVMTQARVHLIEKTVQSLLGAKRAIVHIYNATAPVWRKVVFALTVDEVMQLIEQHVFAFKQLTEQHPETEWILQYSPETFSMTELEVSLRACNTAIRAWDAGPNRKIIINLPTTVENATPNVFADQIEWMDRHLDRREHVILSVHTHNDRGTGVAAAELAQLAGAQRVEGCLFGNGERSGNVDLATLALNLYTQGVDPKLDFSNINHIARVVEECTQLPIHPRHPYVGDLVFTAFSGSHQDAIHKGFAVQKVDQLWQVPYLPIDPADLGRTYESIIRVNSQSGKGGIAYLLEHNYGVVIPRRMNIEFSAEVQRIADGYASEITAPQLWQLFQQTYLQYDADNTARIGYHSHRLYDHPQGQGIELAIMQDAKMVTLSGIGSGPIEAAMNAFDLPVTMLSYEQRSMGAGANAKALAIIEMGGPNQAQIRFGAGVSDNTVKASLLAIISSLNRLSIKV